MLTNIVQDDSSKVNSSSNISSEVISKENTPALLVSAISSLPQNVDNVSVASISTLAGVCTPEIHPAIQQLYALGYEEGDTVTGRNIPPIDGTRTDWHGVLTKDNLQITEYSYSTKRYTGDYHEDGLSWLAEENCDKGIYYNVNGGRDNASVNKFHAVFWESDKGTHEEQALVNSLLPVDLTVAITTRRSTHSYLRVSEEYCHDLELWKHLQQIAAYTFGSDPAVKDLPRLMRLASFDHIKLSSFQLPGEIDYDTTPCKLITCEPDPQHSPEDILKYFAEVRAKLGIKDYSEERFKGYQYINSKLNQKKKGVNYSHENFNPNIFRTCADSEVSELHTRAKLFARLCKQKHEGIACDDPETAWTESLKKVHQAYKKEYEFPLNKVSDSTLREAGLGSEETLSGYFARNYGLGFDARGRNQWHTCQCPAHGSSSGNMDNLHIHAVSGAVKCQSDCTSAEVMTAFRQKAKDAGDTLWDATTYNVDTRESDNNTSGEATNKEFTEEEKQSWIQKKRATGLARWTDSRKFTGAISINVAHVSDGVPTTGFDPREIIAIKSGLGTGKSFWMRLLVENLKAGALILGYRNLLGIQTAKLLGGYHIHRNADEFIANMNNPNAVLSFCVDSLLRFKGNEQVFKNRPVAFDELMSFRKHLLISKHIAPSVRNQCLKILGTVLKICGNIILLDGHLNTAAVQWIHELAGTDRPLRKYYNEKNAEQRTIKFIVGTYKDGYEGQTKFDTDVIDIEGINNNDHSAVESLLVNSTEKFYSFSDSKDSLVSIHKTLTAANPLKKYLLVCADTSSEPDVVAFIENPNDELLKNQYDGVLVSPTGDSGLDISLRGYFNHEYIMLNGVIDASSGTQGIFRPRDPAIETYVSCVANSIAGRRDDNYDVEATRETLKNNFNAVCDLIDDKVFEELGTDYDFKTLIAKVIEQSETTNGRAAIETSVQYEYERRNIRECLNVLLQEAGHNIDYIALPSDTSTKNELKKIKDCIKDEKSEDIFDADLLRESEYTELRTKQHRTPSEQSAITKYKINDKLPGIFNKDISSEFIRKVVFDEPELIRQLQRKFFVENLDITKDFFTKQTLNILKGFIKTGQCLPTAISDEYPKLQAVINIGLLDIINLDSWNVKTPEVRNVIDKINGLEFQKRWGVELKKNKDRSLVAKKFNDKQAMILISEMLEWLGIKTKYLGRPTIDGQRVHSYAYDSKIYQKTDIMAIQECIAAKYAPEQFISIPESDTEIPFGESSSDEPAKVSTGTQLSIFLDMFSVDLVAA
ncbi:hypothetical protein DSM106972_056600 [Dulcicalothrix desertica PCC 7102]|uniref:Replication origin-binding protein domain-containing protein n=1 Tax=Dulcicalothrix desertica PCC 7102 TaxID=232991 RepID=A0A3S1B102_9CYAN|nr:plasmid replication protein, CyRepA1 family [Dulcicalothrix desertica]RUT02740.1 hypothetical protein DSM106972_056600 [Dulcicalothrix desertica PCC 7102]TWH39026.1 hypothetical protein CAL7102_08230 [Dulcicalothrix desertica PCC 7102]